MSVATAVITSIRKNVRTTSQAKDWRSDPAGWVTPRSASGPSVARRGSAATVAPRIWADAYAATLDHGRCRPIAKAIETAGLKWAPEMWPSAYTMTAMTRPKASATDVGGSPFAIAPQPKKTRAKVPRNSAATALKRGLVAAADRRRGARPR